MIWRANSSRARPQALPTVAAAIVIAGCIAIPGVAQTNDPVRGPLVATFEMDREHIYAGEAFALYFSVYSDGPEISNELQLNGLPDNQVLSLRPFSRPLATEDRQLGNRRQIKRYRVKAVAPGPGVIRLTPTLVATVVRRTRGIFSNLRFNSVQIPVIPIRIAVASVPQAGRPDDYSGVIGTASFDVEVDSVEPAPGDLVTITMTVTSPNPLPDFDPPVVELGDSFKAYPTRSIPSDDPGLRRFEKIIVPLSTNAHTISAIRFSYFDTQKRAYQSITRGPFTLTFKERREMHRDRAAVYSETRTPNEVITIDTTPIPPSAWSDVPPPLYRRKGFWMLQAVPMVIYLGIPLLTRRRRGRHTRFSLLLIAAAIPYITLVGAFQTPTDTSMRAFDAQRKEDFREAAALYETEAATAPRTPALFYNLGSSHYLSGRLGHAVLNYARAYRLAPGNEGFKTNLARLSAIAGVPDLLVYRFDAWDRLQPDGWTLLATASYWLLVLIAVVRRLSPGVPIPATLLYAVLVAGGAFSAYGAWTWEAPANRNQAIVMTESKGRFGPMRSARVQFPLREGSAVELLESHADWIKIEVNGDRGWIERSAVERVVH